MPIRAGYTLTFDCKAPAEIIAMLNVHPSRLVDLRSTYELSRGAAPDREDYRDAFSDICARLMLPTSRSTFRNHVLSFS